MLSNINSPFYFSGQESGKTDQWALVDVNNNILLVDQNYRLLKYTQLVLQNTFEILLLSSMPNFSLLDNVKSVMLSIKDNRISIHKDSKLLIPLQEKLMFVRSIIQHTDTELDFYARNIETHNYTIKQKLFAEKEFLQLLVPNDSNILLLYDAEIEILDEYKHDSNRIKKQITESLINCTFDLTIDIEQIKDKFFDSLGRANITLNYFDYFKGTLNELLLR
jgi:hypothetical protein